jgi:hypothetical protein
MTLEITKSGAFLNNGNSVSFIKGINNVINFINNNSDLTVTMDCENESRFARIFSKVSNSLDYNNEAIALGEGFLYKFNFKTI